MDLQVRSVAFLGLGAMGAPMAGRLLEAGHRLTVWNRTVDKTEPLAARGARVAVTPADAARTSDVVITMVRDGPALAAVVEGRDGLASAMRNNTVLVDMSTVGPDAIEAISAVLPPGVKMVDAPVLGSVEEARAGRLQIFVGGEGDVFARLVPLLRVFGEPVLVGRTGAGAAAKLVANSTLFAVLGALGEALALADRLGLSRETTFELLGKTPLAAQAERRRGAIEAGTYPPRFRLALAAKDARLVLEAAARHALELRLAGAVAAELGAAEADGLGDHDYSALVAWLTGEQPR